MDEIGQHPLGVKSDERGIYQRPPQPQYNATWDVKVVLDYLESMGETESLSLRDLTLKLAMLMALTRPSRSSDLAALDLHFRHYLPEGVSFQPVKLAKQSRQGKTQADFFFPSFPHNRRLCPQETLRVYEQRTEKFRSKNGEQAHSRLFLAMVHPHKPVTSSTMARWLRTLLEKAGIDTDIFEAHSTRSAAGLLQQMQALPWQIH